MTQKKSTLHKSTLKLFSISLKAKCLIAPEWLFRAVAMLKLLKILVPFFLVQGFSFAHAENFVRRCHMDNCLWYKIEKRALIGKSQKGKLLKVTYKTWETDHPDGNYNKPQPKQDIDRAIVYILCSKTNPGIAFEQSEKNKYMSYYFAPRDESSHSGASLLIDMMYFNACHNINFEHNDISFAKLAKRLGYSEIDEPKSAEVITDPMSLLK